MKKIAVVGSLNVDLTVVLPRFHKPGETITGKDFATYTGGKGGNQAVAAAKLGVQTVMIGKLGCDQNGALYREVLEGLRIDHAGVAAVKGVPSGVALIEVDETGGDNRIAVVPGANHEVTAEYVSALLPTLLTCDMVLLQLEIPMETVIYVAQEMFAAGKCVVLDPAPAVPLPQELLASVSYLTPNETELHILTGMPTGTQEEVECAAKTLIAKGVGCVAAKLGARGAMLVTEGETTVVKGFAVQAVDTTAAGDSFNAGFAVALLDGEPPQRAIRFANAVAAISTTSMGAQGAMPSRRQVEDFLRAQN